MKFLKDSVAFFTFLFFIPCSYSQHVENASYNLMLKSLLSHSVNELGVKEVYADTTAIFLDAREKNEYQVSHIKNAVWCGYDHFEINRISHVQKNKKIIVYCSVGYRSEKIAEKLINAGYTNVYNMVGGIFEWKNQDFPVVDSYGNSTQKVHAYSKTWGIWLHNAEKIY